MKCLNTSNKLVKAELDELAQALGSEDAAYYIMSENNGYAIDLAPNGALSLLFADLLTKYNGNRHKAIIDKAKLYTSSFKNFFGNWINDPKNASKIDENGEPLTIYAELFFLNNAKVNETQDNKINNITHRIGIIDLFGSLPNLTISSINVIRNIFYTSEQKNIYVDPNIRSMLQLFEIYDIPMEVTYDTKETKYMWYDQTLNKVFINGNLFNSTSDLYNFRSITHEIVHYFTSRQLELLNQGKLKDKDSILMYESLKILYEYFNNENLQNRDEFYGLKDIHEFVAELLTNDSFLLGLLEYAYTTDNSGNILSNLIFSFIDKLSQIIDKLFGTHLREVTKDEIIDAKKVAFEFLSHGIDIKLTSDEIFSNEMINSAKKLNQAKYQFDSYNFTSLEEFNRRMQSIRSSLLSGLEVRLRSIDDPDPARNRQLKQIVQYQIKNLQNEAIDTMINVKDFVSELVTDMRSVAQEVLDAYTGKIDALTDEKLISLDRNYFSFYCKHANEIYNSLVNLNSYREYIGAQDYDKLLQELDICKRLLDGCADHVKKMLIQNAKRQIEKVALLVGDLGIYYYLREGNITETGEDISWFSRVFGSGDKINDSAIKSIYQLVQDAEDKINSETFEKALKLNKLLKQAGNKLFMLFETDSNGNPTGYMIRKRNYGAFQKNYRKAMEDIRNKLGIGPNELNLPENKSLRVEFNKRKNAWLSEHCERKFTSEYYDLLNGLSEEASNAREMIMTKIRDLCSKYKDSDGIVLYEKMTDTDWDNLQSYYLEKQMLTSKYDAKGVEKAQGTIERQIADELSELNLKLAKGLKTKVNEEKFELLRKKKLSELSALDYDKWLKRNTRTEYSDEFYELLKKIDRKDYGEEYKRLNDEKRELLDTYRDPKTGEINPKAVSNSILNRVNRIDILLRAIRKKKKNSGETKSGLSFEDVAKVVPTEKWYKDYERALASSLDDPGSLEAFLLSNANRGADGRAYPKSWYTKIVPKDPKYINLYAPSMNFSEISEESPFYNKNYDRLSEEDKDEYYQPKLSKYNNIKAYNNAIKQKGLTELREALLQTIQESNERLPNLHGLNKYKLPLMDGSTYRFIKAYYKQAKGIKEILLAPLVGLKESYLDKVSVKNDDIGIQKKPNIAPDGTSLAMIPLYFVQDLKNPATITANLVGSVIMYYRMASNFEHKSAVKPKVEIIKSLLRQRNYTGISDSDDNLSKIDKWLKSRKNPKIGIETNTYKFAQKFVDMNVYDVRTLAITFTVKLREFNVTKALGLLLAYGTLRNLGLNLYCAGTGFFTAIHNHLMNIVCGRYYDFNDAVNGFKDLIFDMFTRGVHAGSKTYKSKQMALMDYFEVGGTVDSLYKNTHRPKWLNVIADNWAFGLYSTTDYIVKGNILNSVMYNFRNVNGEFICKEDYLNKYGNTELTRHKWNSYVSAKGSIDFVAGKIVVKNKADQEAWDKAKYKIGRTAQNLAASADGMLTKLLKAQFAANAFGALCMMHRLYIPLAIQEKWTMDKLYDYTSQRWVEATMKSVIRLFLANYKDSENLSYLQRMSKLYKEDEVIKYNVKRAAAESVLILAIYPFLASLLNEKADEDKKNKLLNVFAYIMLRTSFESGAPYNLVDIYGTIKTPTPIYGLLDNFGGLPSYITLLIVDAFRDKPKHGKLTRGAYKGETYLTKSLWLTTPFKNVKELNDIPTKRNYYKKLIIGD